MSPDLIELLPEIALFVAVANAKSFSRGARALGMPVSTVSRRINRLERRLGLQLLVRTPRLVDLTAVGASYLARCQPIVEAAELAHAELSDHLVRPRGLLRVSTTADFMLTFLTPLFAEFAARYPDIAFEFDLSPRAVDLVAENFDVAIRIGALPDSQLTARRLGALTSGLYAAPSYLARVGALRSPRDLEPCECIRAGGARATTATWILERGRARATVPIRGRFVVNNLSLALELAVLGMGVVAIDEAMAHRAVAAGTLVRVLPAWSPPAMPVHALTPSRLLPAKTKLFLDCLGEHLALRRATPPRSPGRAAPVSRGRRGAA
jgi:DNA-binding transcriptional LysR family regulator